METGWLIESENTMYIGIKQIGAVAYPYWTADHNAALRFARKEDAEAIAKVLNSRGMVGFHEDAKGATQHQWDVD